MRARYTAYAIGNADFLIDTTHPDGPHAQLDRGAWKAELLEYCGRTLFEGLTVHEHHVDEDAGRATVTFSARLVSGGQDVGFTERSTFVRDGNRWRYHCGEMLEGPPDAPSHR